MKTIKLQGGKYTIEFDDETSQVVDYLRYGESWPAGNELRYSGVVTALVQRLVELEAIVTAYAEKEANEKAAALLGTLP